MPIVKLDPLSSHPSFIAGHQDMFPKEMRETDPAEWAARIIDGGFAFGWAHGDALKGWAICSAEEPRSRLQVYWYDLAVLPGWQRGGVAKALMAHMYAELRWAGLAIRMHTRQSTYPRNEEGLRRSGYRIARDIFVPNHYRDEYGIDEDAHELLLVPIGSAW